jgi:hypothetical protein
VAVALELLSSQEYDRIVHPSIWGDVSPAASAEVSACESAAQPLELQDNLPSARHHLAWGQI